MLVEIHTQRYATVSIASVILEDSDAADLMTYSDYKLITKNGNNIWNNVHSQLSENIERNGSVMQSGLGQNFGCPYTHDEPLPSQFIATHEVMSYISNLKPVTEEGNELNFWQYNAKVQQFHIL